MVAAPLVAEVDSRALDAPRGVVGRIAAGGDVVASRLHLVGKGVQDTHSEHGIGPGVEAGVDRGGDVEAAVGNVDVGEPDDTPGGQRVAEVPAAGFVEDSVGRRLVERVVLLLVEGIDPSAECSPIEFHHATLRLAPLATRPV